MAVMMMGLGTGFCLSNALAAYDRGQRFNWTLQMLFAAFGVASLICMHTIYVN